MAPTQPSVAAEAPAPEHQVRVFISSTFRDMRAERDHLVTVVFPQLRERVEQLGLEFLDVDLRWRVVPGDFDIMVGKSSADIHLQGILKVTP